MILIGPKGILDDVVKNLKYSDWCESLPFSWNPTEKRLEKKTRKTLRYLGIRLSISILYTAFAVIQVVRVFKGSDLIVKTHSIMFISCLIFCLSCHLVNYTELPNVTELFNTLIDFEVRFEQIKNNVRGLPSFTKKKQQATKLLKYFLFAMTCTGTVMPVVYHLDILRNPCYPLYVGYWLSDQCDEKKLGIQLKASWSVQEIGTKFGIAMVSYFVWSFMISGCMFQISLECIVQGHCLRSYVAEFGR